jgi:hypothetical protein
MAEVNLILRALNSKRINIKAILIVDLLKFREPVSKMGDVSGVFGIWFYILEEILTPKVGVFFFQISL